MRARDTVEDRLEAPWQLGGMARTAGMAPHHFRRRFGAPPSHFADRA